MPLPPDCFGIRGSAVSRSWKGSSIVVAHYGKNASSQFLSAAGSISSLGPYGVPYLPEGLQP
ncbi:hypothetical protein E4U49_004139 [Claviceps purpurea]|nr:hypothetical protein E4U49_004139 [Claviceps purpurea]